MLEILLTKLNYINTCTLARIERKHQRNRTSTSTMNRRDSKTEGNNNYNNSGYNNTVSDNEDNVDADDLIQIVAMSATLANPRSLSAFVNAYLYITDFRPVPLQQFVKIGTELFDERMNKVHYVSVCVVHNAYVYARSMTACV